MCYDPHLIEYLEDKLVTKSDKFLLLDDGTKDPCFLWKGAKNERGYGRREWKGRKHYVHRMMAAWIAKRELEDHEVAMHLCNNPSCCHPRHIVLGTIKENAEHRARCGRSYTGRKRRKRLTPTEVQRIRIALKYMRYRVSSLACEFGVGIQTIRDIRDGNTWRHLPMPKKTT